MRSDLVIECHQIQLCDIECLIRYEYKSGSHQTEIIDFYVICLLYVSRLYSYTTTSATSTAQKALPQRLRKLYLNGSTTFNRDNTNN